MMAVAAVATVGALTLTALPAAASSTHKTTTTTHPKKKVHKKKAKSAGITKSAAGQQYLADIAPFNAAVGAFKGDSDDNLSALAGEVAPIVSAAQTFESTILRQQWPSNTQADIKALATAVGTFESDVSNFGSSSASDISSAEQTMVQADGTFGADSNIVRADLGLPPPPSS